MTLSEETLARAGPAELSRILVDLGLEVGSQTDREALLLRIARNAWRKG